MNDEPHTHGGPSVTILQALDHCLRRRFIEPFPLVISGPDPAALAIINARNGLSERPTDRRNDAILYCRRPSGRTPWAHFDPQKTRSLAFQCFFKEAYRIISFLRRQFADHWHALKSAIFAINRGQAKSCLEAGTTILPTPGLCTLAGQKNPEPINVSGIENASGGDTAYA